MDAGALGAGSCVRRQSTSEPAAAPRSSGDTATRLVADNDTGRVVVDKRK
jgi:hypothetical protein